jgi:quercetin dioxygenase-like cupin family protein
MDLIKTNEARVVRTCLDPGEISPAQYHSSVIESVVCLSGEIAIKIGAASDWQRLSQGQMLGVMQQVEHYLMNPSNSKSEYLLVQKGDFDFVAVD